MPAESIHARQTQHNEEYLDTFDLGVTPYLDWAVTVMFYTALHYVEWYLATKNLHPADHTIRDSYLQRTRDLKPIWPDYRRLKDRSEKARYEGALFMVEEAQKLKSRLSDIETHVRGFLPSTP